MTSPDPTSAAGPPPVLLPVPPTPEHGLAVVGPEPGGARAGERADGDDCQDGVARPADDDRLDGEAAAGGAAAGGAAAGGAGRAPGAPRTPLGPPPLIPGAFWWPAPDDLPPPRPHDRRPAASGPLPPGFLLATPSGSPPPRIDVPATLERLRSAQRTYAAALLGAVAVALTSLPWSLMSGVLAVVGIVAGARALHLASLLRRAGTATRGRIATGIGLGVSTMLLMQMLVQLVIYPVEHDYQVCKAAAQTKTAQQACRDAREHRLKLDR